MHCDSQSALFLIQNAVYHVQTKYIDIRYHRVRELVEEGEVEQVKVHTKENQVDALMKTLSRDSFHRCVLLMGLIDRSDFAEAMGHQGGDCGLKCGAFKPLVAKDRAIV